VTFKKWLLYFTEVKLPIGDLARDVAMDKNFPDSNDYKNLIEYLEDHSAGDLQIDVFNRCWKFYKIEFP